MRTLHIFDLDMTVLCSKHRQATLPCGALDLEHWRENSTPEKVALDSCLPLAEKMRDCWRAGHLVAICTARVMSRADWELLEREKLFFHFALHRGENDTRRDHDLKREKITDLFIRMRLAVYRWNDVYLYDDNQAVLTMAESLGIKTIDSIAENARLQGMG